MIEMEGISLHSKLGKLLGEGDGSLEGKEPMLDGSSDSDGISVGCDDGAIETEGKSLGWKLGSDGSDGERDG